MQQPFLLKQTIWNGFRYRVAAPSIRFVPWAALASCWPLPQQLLPVSATGGGRRRCTLAIFTEGVVEENCLSTVALFPMKKGENAIRSAALSQKAALQMPSTATTPSS